MPSPCKQQPRPARRLPPLFALWQQRSALKTTEATCTLGLCWPWASVVIACNRGSAHANQLQSSQLELQSSQLE